MRCLFFDATHRIYQCSLMSSNLLARSTTLDIQKFGTAVFCFHPV